MNLVGHRQQVIQGQQERLAQLHDHEFLGWGEGGLQAMGCMGTVGNPVTTLSAADGILTHAQLIG